MKAFLAASREGDFAALVSMLDPDVVLRVEDVTQQPSVRREIRGIDVLLERAHNFARAARFCRVALLDGNPGLVMAPGGQLTRALLFSFAGDRVTSIEVIADPVRLRALDVSVPEADAH